MPRCINYQRRHAHADWKLPEGDNGALKTWDDVSRAVLLDIRDELYRLNEVMSCFRVQRMSDDIHRIDKRLAAHLPLRKRGRRP